VFHVKHFGLWIRGVDKVAQIIDGKAMAQGIREDVAGGVKELKSKKNITPKLVVMLVGEDPGSQVYVRNKEKACIEAGMHSETIKLDASIKENELIDIVKRLNGDRSVHGILVQLPLPNGLNELAVLNVIDPKKDVDGLHPMNMGMMLKGEGPYFLPCTPHGVMEMLLSTGIEIKGKNAVVVGRSNIVGKPMAILLLEKHATVTVCHSRTNDLAAECRRGDILVAAVGRPKMIKGEWVKPGAIVIDVGMNRLETGLVGDVDFESAKEVASYITPVPKGVGPMTIAMLLKNTLIAAERA